MKNAEIKKTINTIINDWRLFTEDIAEENPAKEDLISDMWEELEALEDYLINKDLFADIREFTNRINYMKHCLKTNEEWIAEELEEEMVEDEEDWDEVNIIITKDL